MQRKKNRGYRARRFWPVFWRSCESCDFSFRLERGWRIVCGETGMEYDVFICGECADSPRAAVSAALRSHEIPFKPPIS